MSMMRRFAMENRMSKREDYRKDRMSGLWFGVA
jgi:hypothetical protein